MCLQLTFLGAEVKSSILLSVPGESDRSLPDGGSLIDFLDLIRCHVVFSLERIWAAVFESAIRGVNFRWQFIVPVYCTICSF